MKQIAINIIESAFAGKKDKGDMPYILHLYRVASNVKKYFKGDDFLEELETIALLHDLLEDCPEWTEVHLSAIFKNINVVSAVKKLTKRDGVSYDKYIADIKNDRFARAVKLADLEDNMNVFRLKELTDKDSLRLIKYLKAYQTLLGKEENKPMEL